MSNYIYQHKSVITPNGDMMWVSQPTMVMGVSEDTSIMSFFLEGKPSEEKLYTRSKPKGFKKDE